MPRLALSMAEGPAAAGIRPTPGDGPCEVAFLQCFRRPVLNSRIKVAIAPTTSPPPTATATTLIVNVSGGRNNEQTHDMIAEESFRGGLFLLQEHDNVSSIPE